MKYETPELTALTPAIDAIQAIKVSPNPTDGVHPELSAAAYEDWE
jgi:hypothetical protein